MTPWGNNVLPPRTCLSSACNFPIVARGLCIVCLQKATKHNLLFKEYLPDAMGHKSKPCVGKPSCTRKEAIFGRCPDCLYDWQFTTATPRDFFKGLTWPEVSFSK